ncbi:YcxB family protein [Deminuibacter soli]|uniref:YcxB family protein n=1 Tax=Deminuibacter soli TaxID=2291815 RepID=A0A3E1NP66_9BACT|nr:YcxB family protein [Deminuibacter soli]RFM29710.1 YcxB family protein [Deminuibacter soli]
MQLSFSYDRKKVIQGLRYHFITRPEIRILVILVNVFAIVAAVLFYMKKIRPEPFLLGSCLWLLMMMTFWYILPVTIYKRSATFKDRFSIFLNETNVRLENGRGYVNWEWKQFAHYFESPNFFHLYFSARSFFLLPKENMTAEFSHELRGLLGRKIEKKVKYK